MADSSNNTRLASPVAGLAAPLMSASSSSSSINTSMWSAGPSRRGSNASSIAPLEMLCGKETAPVSAPVSAPVAAPVAAPVSTPARRTRLVHTADPMSRKYPKPEGEINVKEALAREPLPWSLGHWCKYAPDAVAPKKETHDEIKQRFQDIKDEMLRLHASLGKSTKNSGPRK